MKKKLLLLVDSLETNYGWGTVGFYMLKELQLKYEVTLINAKEYKIDRFHGNFFRPFLIFFTYLKILKRIHKDCEIVINTAENLLGLLFLIKYFNKKIITISMGYGTYSYFPFVTSSLKKIHRLYLSSVDYLFLSSNYTINKVKEFYKKEVYLLPLGIDLNKYSKISNIKKEKSFVFVGAQKSRKGVEYLIEAVNIVKKLHPDIKVYLVGQQSSIYKEKINKLNLQDNFVSLGKISHEELLKTYSKCIANILPSVNMPDSFEGFGLIHLEANACGIPSIGSSNTANDDVIIDGITGYLAKQKDPKDIANKMIKLIDNKDEFQQNIPKLLDHAKLFSWKKTVQNIQTIAKI